MIRPSTVMGFWGEGARVGNNYPIFSVAKTIMPIAKDVRVFFPEKNWKSPEELALGTGRTSSEQANFILEAVISVASERNERLLPKEMPISFAKKEKCRTKFEANRNVSEFLSRQALEEHVKITELVRLYVVFGVEVLYSLPEKERYSVSKAGLVDVLRRHCREFL